MQVSGPSGRVGWPSPDLRKVLNASLYIEITGSRWCGVPKLVIVFKALALNMPQIAVLEMFDFLNLRQR